MQYHRSHIGCHCRTLCHHPVITICPLHPQWGIQPQVPGSLLLYQCLRTCLELTQAAKQLGMTQIAIASAQGMAQRERRRKRSLHGRSLCHLPKRPSRFGR